MDSDKIKFINFIILFFFISQSFAQANFENGFFINNSGEKINCLINNEDWISNPVQFEYKLSESAEIKIGSLSNIQTFAVGTNFKYERVTADIDRDIIDQNSNDGYNFDKETLYLKVLVEGDINLYHLEDERLNIFFIKQNDNIEQLKHKSYFNEDYKLRYDNSFRKQLYTSFNSKIFRRERLKKVEYNTNDLISLFADYNKGRGPVNVYYKKTKLNYNIYAKLGINSSSFNVQGGDGIVDIPFSNDSNLRFGAEFELMAPYSKEKWSAFISPSYRSYSSELISNAPISDLAEGLTNFNAVDYTSFEIPIGVRRYFFLNKLDNMKFYLNAAYFFDIVLENNLIILGEQRSLKSDVLGFNFMIGGGLQFNDFGLEFLYFTPRDLVQDISGFESDFKNIAVNLTYKIF